MGNKRKGRYSSPPPPPPVRDGEVSGRIVIVQEDRFRLIDESGRGYLFVARKRSVSQDELERWRDEGKHVSVVYHGIPDLGAVARSVRPT